MNYNTPIRINLPFVHDFLTGIPIDLGNLEVISPDDTFNQIRGFPESPTDIAIDVLFDLNQQQDFYGPQDTMTKRVDQSCFSVFLEWLE